MKTIQILVLLIFYLGSMESLRLEDQLLVDTISRHAGVYAACPEVCSIKYIGEFCKGIVNYTFCPIYNNIFGSTQLDQLAQIAYEQAVSIANLGLGNTININSDCRNAIKRFACWSVFRECSFGESQIYNYPCESACTNIAIACHTYDAATCSTYPRNLCTARGGSSILLPNWNLGIFFLFMFMLLFFSKLR